jgi:transcriptional regulator with XRE-family HTH domain
MSANVEIGHQLRHLRLARRLTRKQLSRKVGLTRLGVARIENGSRQTRINTIARIATALGGVIRLRILPKENPWPEWAISQEWIRRKACE